MKTVIFHEMGQIVGNTTPALRMAKNEKAGIKDITYTLSLSKEECCFKVVHKSGIS